ncbi:hypothetical protein DOC17_20040 [Salmonella enterica subsp. enterica serovar Senftenberg]|nr:hypothetical protein [Salmonella enterica subsp. enterica serovar Senftenberg]
MADIILIIFMNVFLTCHIRYYYHAANFIAIFSICAFLPVCRLIESCVIFIFFSDSTNGNCHQIIHSSNGLTGHSVSFSSIDGEFPNNLLYFSICYCLINRSMHNRSNHCKDR